ncbi:NAD(P)/FAD-dependent oxidoreductase [Paraburkholderia fungorum]|uniref:oxidoreductase n=1 Tax=Paraburkholderia fungorum TaxID=134537 RepID=UPI0038B98F79
MAGKAPGVDRAPRSTNRDMLIAQPGHIGPLKLRNRIVMAPMGTNYSTTDGLSTQRDKQYYAERAKGGVAMIMTEAMVVTEHARPHHNSLCVYHDRFIPGLASIVEAIKEHDCHVFGQLNHRGALLRRSVLNMEPVGPSPWRNPNTGDAVRALAIAEIDEIQRLFVAAARRLWQAGYDGVELHAANGYLFQQFLTPRINKRTDRYGGSLENRVRLLRETLVRLRNEVPDLLPMVRLSATEFAEGGYTQDEIVEVAKILEANGCVAIDVSGGSNESPQLSKYTIQPPSFARGFLAPYAKPIKDAVGIPVLVAGRIIEAEDAEAVLASGSADFISLGRALYADPHWCDKAMGRIDAPVRACISCNMCFERLTTEKDVSCVVNPMVGTEFEALEFAEPQLFDHPDRHGPRRRVLVIGAGLTGIEAARVAAGNGHHVEIWEREPRAGGQIHLAVAAPDKADVWGAWTYRWREIEALGVRVVTRKEATLEAIRAFAPDFVVVATGAAQRPAPFDLSALSSTVRVLHAWEALSEASAVAAGASVTVIGGGMVGMETADLLSECGARVTVIETLPTLANGMARNNRFELLDRLRERGVTLMSDTRVQQIAGERLEVIDAQGQTQWLEIGNALIIAIGPRPNSELADVLSTAGIDHSLAGDAYRPGDFLSCIRDAWMLALSIETRYRSSAADADAIRRAVRHAEH